MKYYKICKYNYEDPSYKDDWTTPDELIARLGKLPKEYFKLEDDFLQIPVRFLEKFDDGALKFDHYYFCHKDFPNSKDPELPIELYDSLPISAKEIAWKLSNGDFNRLSTEEKKELFRLVLRDMLSIAISHAENGACIASMDDGFYWFLAIPDSENVEFFTEGLGFYTYDWHNIFED